jgi:hypothetical protein
MWRRHLFYESRPRSVIISLGCHLYRIPEVVLSIVTPKKCHKVESHTEEFIFFTICSKGEQKDTANTTALAQEPFIQQKKVDKTAVKCKDSFYTHASDVSILVKNVQPFHPHVRDNLQQAKHLNFSNKENNSSRCRFSKCFPLSPEKSTQWRPFLPKEGVLI